MSITTQLARKVAICIITMAAFLFVAPIVAQRPLIKLAVDNESRVTLTGSVHPLAIAGNDQGVVSDDTPTGSLMLVLGRSSSLQSSLDNYARAVSTPGSANFGKYLTTEQFGTKYGADANDISQIRSWLEANGFKVESISSANNLIRFSGTAGNVRSAFHTEIHSYTVNGVSHLANASQVSIPEALAPAIRGVAALHNFRMQPNYVRHGSVSLAGVATTAGTSTTGSSRLVHPDLSVYGPSTWGTDNYDMYFLPAAGDAAVIYDTPNTAMNPTYSGTTYTGSAVTVGIVGDSNLNSTQIKDVIRYRSLFLNETYAAASVDAQLPNVILDGTDPGNNSDAMEAITDIEMVSAFAPKALINYYAAASTDLQDGVLIAIKRAVDDNAVSILNISFGACEASLGASGNAFINEIYEQAAAQGITVTVSSGDSGSIGCGTMSSGLGVNGLASTPWNVAVGGTDFYPLFTTDLSTIAKYITVPSATISFAATSPYATSALGYIAEQPWNDSTSVFTTYANNIPYRWGNAIENMYAAGGGVSSSAVCSSTINSSGTCTGTLSGYTKPAYQTSLTPADGVRDVPDVSFFSGSFMGDSGYSNLFNNAWSICADGITNGDGYAYNDCNVVTGTALCNGTCTISPVITSTSPIGGTSTAAPAMAGILALVIQANSGKRIGQANYALYNLASSTPTIFHDVTQGNNSVICTTGTTNCGSNGFANGYNAATGYDLASGIGSIDVAKLVNNWSKATYAATTTTLKAGTSSSSLSSGALSIAHGATTYFQVSVSPASATGYVALTTNSTNSNSDAVTVAAISGGVAVFNTAALPGGTYTLYARYGGDSSYQASTSTGIAVTVSAETSTQTIALNVYSAKDGTLTTAAATTAVYGSAFVLDITPYGTTEGAANGNSASGTVTISLDGTALSTVTLNSLGVGYYTITSTLLSPGTHTIQSAYSGDSNYKAVTSSLGVTITKATVAELVGTNFTQTLAAGGIAYVSLLMRGYSHGADITGSATLYMNGVAYKTIATPSYVEVDTDNERGDYWYLTADASAIGIGNTATFTATYSGDTNYNSATSATYTITVAEPTGASISLSNSAGISIASKGNSGTSTVTVTPGSGFVGTVALTCTLTSGTAASYNPTCTVPSSVTIADTTAQTATLTISTTAAGSKATSGGLSAMLGMSGGLTTLAGVFMLFVPKRKLRYLALTVVAFGLTLGASGCGGGGSVGTTTTTGTPSGSYTFTVTGARGTITGSTTVTVTVP